MQRVLVTPERFQTSDELLHIVHPIARRDENGILGFDHDGIRQADDRDQPALGVEIAARGVLDQHVAAHDVAVLVRRAGLVQRRP